MKITAAMCDKNKHKFDSSRVFFAIIAMLGAIALIHTWTGHKANIGGFFIFLTTGAYISYWLPRLLKAKKTGKLGNRFYTVYRDKQPVGFFLGLYLGGFLGNLIFAWICIYFYLSIFGVVPGP